MSWGVWELGNLRDVVTRGNINLAAGTIGPATPSSILDFRCMNISDE
jgi:hypothetical protein